MLNALFSTSFRKELIAGHHFDFVDDCYLIEHTRDYGKGIMSATKRFEAARDDPRTKILYANLKHFGPKRRKRLADLHVEVRDYRELDQS